MAFRTFRVYIHTCLNCRYLTWVTTCNHILTQDGSNSFFGWGEKNITQPTNKCRYYTTFVEQFPPKECRGIWANHSIPQPRTPQMVFSSDHVFQVSRGIVRDSGDRRCIKDDSFLFIISFQMEHCSTTANG